MAEPEKPSRWSRAEDTAWMIGCWTMLLGALLGLPALFIFLVFFAARCGWSAGR